MIPARFVSALAIATLAAISFLAIACGNDTGETGSVAPSAPAPTASTQAETIAQQNGLHLQAQTTAVSATLPRNIEASSQWGIIQHASLRGGYDLRPYAGQKVNLTSYRLTERYDDQPLDLCLVSKGREVVGVYLVYDAYPGILGLTDIGLE